VHLSLAPLGAPAGLPRAALYAVVALAAGLVVSFVAAPLRVPRRSTVTDEASETEEVALHERDAVYAALRDLDHDHETAKISDEDYQAMRGELRARAAALMKTQRASGAAGGARSEAKPSEVHRDSAAAGARSEPKAIEADQDATAPAIFCTACGAGARPNDRFCAQCGARIEAREARA
jgi:hypothetical protein